jgi:hypothetical protein
VTEWSSAVAASHGISDAFSTGSQNHQLVVLGSGGERIADAERQEYPRPQHPGPHRAGKGRADIAGDERAYREGKSHRKPDIADVERRWMKGEAGILEQRVQPLPFRGRGAQPPERIGGEQQKGIEAEADEGLRGKRRNHRPLAQPPLEQGDRAARHGEDRHPHQHRALVVPPGSREFV